MTMLMTERRRPLIEDGQETLFGGGSGTKPRPAARPWEPREDAPAPPRSDEITAADLRSRRAPGARLAEPTLDDVVTRAWESLVIGLPAACPVCHGEVAPTTGGPLSGRCGSCGVTID